MDRFGRGCVVYISRCRGDARGLAALRVVLSRRKFALLPQQPQPTLVLVLSWVVLVICCTESDIYKERKVGFTHDIGFNHSATFTLTPSLPAAPQPVRLLRHRLLVVRLWIMNYSHLELCSTSTDTGLCPERIPVKQKHSHNYQGQGGHTFHFARSNRQEQVTPNFGTSSCHDPTGSRTDTDNEIGQKTKNQKSKAIC